MAPPDGWRMTDGSEPVAITQRELLMELREDVRYLREAMAAMAKEQARLADSIRQEQELGAERRVNMRRAADILTSRVDDHERQLEELRRWRDRADGAMVLARWALGASLISLVAVALQVLSTLSSSVRFAP
jgi:Flp pilus assembly protein TadB